jgi:hypothetical protein
LRVREREGERRKRVVRLFVVLAKRKQTRQKERKKERKKEREREREREHR